MRVSQETREKTRQAILLAARSQFSDLGFGAAKTRRIAAAAGIAAGTLFNYFPNKEALGLALVAEATEAADAEFEQNRRSGEGLEELLFDYVITQLRYFEPLRTWIAPVLEVALSPLRNEAQGSLAGDLRRRHLARVSKWLSAEKDAGVRGAESAVDLHLYWSLYLGIVSFWSQDDSHNTEATLALLDRSIGLFCRALIEE